MSGATRIGLLAGLLSAGCTMLVGLDKEYVPDDRDQVVDEDCNGKFECMGSPVWSKGFGGLLDQRVSGVAVDPVNSILLTGFFEGSVGFGGEEWMSAGGWDVFMVRLDSEGVPLWSKIFGDAGDQFAYGIASDAAGNFLVTGAFAGALDFGGGSIASTGSSDVFIAKFNNAGTHVWSNAFGDLSNQYSYAVATNSSGILALTGDFEGTLNFGSGSESLASAGSYDVFVAKFAADGSCTWSKRFGDALHESGRSVAIDDDGGIIVTGFFDEDLDFGGGTLTNAGGHDIFLVKLDDSGNHVWSKHFGDTGNEYSAGVALDSAGNIVLVGSVESAVDFGSGVLTTSGGSDAFVATFDPQGNPLWSKLFGDDMNQLASTVTTDSSGNIVLAGEFLGSVNFGGESLISAGDIDMFVAKFDAGGHHLWSKAFGGSQYQSAASVAIDATENIVLAGHFSASFSLGDDSLVNTQGTDVYVTKFIP